MPRPAIASAIKFLIWLKSVDLGVKNTQKQSIDNSYVNNNNSATFCGWNTGQLMLSLVVLITSWSKKVSTFQTQQTFWSVNTGTKFFSKHQSRSRTPFETTVGCWQLLNGWRYKRTGKGDRITRNRPSKQLKNCRNRSKTTSTRTTIVKKFTQHQIQRGHIRMKS